MSSVENAASHKPALSSTAPISDPTLKAVIEAWPTLPDEVKNQIVGIVREYKVNFQIVDSIWHPRREQ